MVCFPAVVSGHIDQFIDVLCSFFQLLAFLWIICKEIRFMKDHLDGHMYVEKVEGEIHDVQYADPEDEEDWEEIDEEA